MQIHPNIQSLHLKLGRSITSGFLGSYATKFTGRGIEFADIRKYAEGDSIKRIDWRTSAKKGEWYTKEYEEERQLRVWFVRESGLIYKRTHLLYDKIQELVYAISYAALRNGDRIGAIMSNEIGSIHRENMSGTWEGLWRILYSSTSAEKDDSYHLPYFKRIMKYIFQGPPKSADSPIGINELLRMLIRLRVTGSLLVIPTSSLEIDVSYIKKLGISNEILFVHVFPKASMSCDGDEPFIQFGAGKKSVCVGKRDGAKLDEYSTRVQNKLAPLKRVVQSVGGTYLLLDETKDVVRELMGVMR